MEHNELQKLLNKIHFDHGLDFSSYRMNYIKRRIDSRLRATKSKSYDDYIGMISRDLEEYNNLLNCLTVNITEFFRDKEVWDLIYQNVLPNVYLDFQINKSKSKRKEILIWSAGCSDGCEPYSLAILWDDFLKKKNDELPLRIVATDIDKECLNKSEEGIYLKKIHLKNISEQMINKYFQKIDEEKYVILDKIKKYSEFKYHDISKKNAIDAFDMIVCRNVMIFFSRSLQEKVLLSFYESLRPGGYLILGKVESLWGDLNNKFKTIDRNNKIFQKNA